MQLSESKALTQGSNIFFLWPWTLTCNLNLQTWPT